jgi:predicted secreted protein
MADLALTEVQNGGHFALRVGDAVVITLAEGAGGYRWSIVSLDQAFLAVESHHYEAGRGGVGSAGSAEWRLRARREGRTGIELRKSRPWEAADTAIERFTVSLDVRGG